MRFIPMLLLILLISVIVLPVAAEDAGYEDMLKKAQNLNVTVPEKGTALMGTKESMGEYLDWLHACSEAMITFIDDVMNVFGVGNTSYALDMKKTLEMGRTISPARTGK
ncbi:MAG: hypothetical protein Q7U51_11080 [Methanoregula sp.]|nr:hypothetical protein [Methanoregula sp.]